MTSPLRKKIIAVMCITVIAGSGVASLARAVTPFDPDLPLQNYLLRVKAPSAWDVLGAYTQQRNVVIAIFDTGVDIDHPDIAPSIWRNENEIPGDGIDNDNNSYIDDVNGWDFVQSVADPRPKLTTDYEYEAVNHGTVVAGILAAAHNLAGIAGAAPGAKVMPLRVLDSKGSGNTIVLSEAIDYAIENGADVINLSLVGESSDPRLSEAISRAYRAGIAVVAASGNQGNSGINLNSAPRYPVCEEGKNEVIGVAAVDAFNKLATFSNFGSRCIDVAAPGTHFYSTVWRIPGNSNFDKSYAGGLTGTSVAAPLVSATLAMIKMVAPNISLADAYRVLLANTTSLEDTNANPADLGAGLLDMKRTLEKAVELSRKKPVRIVLSQGVGFEPKVLVKDKDGVTLGEFFAYAPRFRGGVIAGVGDVDGDGTSDIVTVPLSSGGPHVRLFDQQGNPKGQFMAYPTSFRGGLSLAIGDLNNDGKSELLVAPLSGYKPEVRVFNGRGDLLSSFLAYGERFRGGVQVSVGDIDGDGRAEILTVPAKGGGPHVRFFDPFGGLKGQFMALQEEYRGGLTAGIGDVDGDGRSEIVVAPESEPNPLVRIFSARAQEKNRFPLYPGISDVAQPARLLVGDYTGDGQADIVSYPLTVGASLRVFDYFGRLVTTIDLSGNNAAERSIRYSFVISK